MATPAPKAPSADVALIVHAVLTLAFVAVVVVLALTHTITGGEALGSFSGVFVAGTSGAAALTIGRSAP